MRLKHIRDWRFFCFWGLGLLAFSQDLRAQNEAKVDYKFEISPLVGKNLPYDLWGTPGTLSVYGLRAAVPLPTGALEGGVLYQVEGTDKAYTLDFGYRYDTYFETLNFVLDVGVHASKFSLTVDYDSLGACVPANCSTDSGTHMGYYFGGGLSVPLSPAVPLRLRMRFYKSPQVWLLLNAEVALRF